LVIGGLLVGLLMVFGVGAAWFSPYDPDAGELLDRLRQPDAEHPLGTDALGRDILTRLMYGARVSLFVGIAAVAAGAAVGVPLGLWAGFRLGRVDVIIMRVMDMLLSMPRIVTAIVIMAVLGAGVGNLVFAIALWNVPVFARITRSSTLSLRAREFVTAAKAVGSGDLRVVFKHILPNASTEIVVTASLMMAGAIMTESGLSFLGLGVPPHVPSWGMMISEGRAYLRTAAHVTTFSGVAIMLAVLGFNLLGDGLRDAMSPGSHRRLKGR